MTLQEHIQTELGGSWEEKLENSKKNILSIMQKMFIDKFFDEFLQKTNYISKDEVMKNKRAYDKLIKENNPFLNNPFVFSEENIEDIIKLLNDPTALLNYTIEILQFKINLYLRLLQKIGFHPDGFIEKLFGPEDIDKVTEKYGFSDNIYQYFSENFKSIEEFREYLTNIAGIEFISFDEVKEAKKQLDNELITVEDFEIIESKSGILYIPYGWSYNFPESRLNNWNYERYLKVNHLPKILQSTKSV